MKMTHITMHYWGETPFFSSGENKKYIFNAGCSDMENGLHGEGLLIKKIRIPHQYPIHSTQLQPRITTEDGKSNSKNLGHILYHIKDTHATSSSSDFKVLVG